MDIQTRKIAFVQAFLKLRNEEVISKFEKLLWENEPERKFHPFSKKELNERISKSEKDFENDRFKTTAELLSKY